MWRTVRYAYRLRSFTNLKLVSKCHRLKSFSVFNYILPSCSRELYETCSNGHVSITATYQNEQNNRVKRQIFQCISICLWWTIILKKNKRIAISPAENINNAENNNVYFAVNVEKILCQPKYSIFLTRFRSAYSESVVFFCAMGHRIFQKSFDLNSKSLFDAITKTLL